jgi:sugar/nucleoside kinase (ribokinase family)
MPKGIAIAGNIVADTVKAIDGYPSPGMLSSILSVSRSPGGAVPNMSIDLKLMDPSLEVRALGLVGEDENGEYVVGAMASCGVDVSGVGRAPGTVTAFTDVMADSATNERTFFHARGANSLFSPEHIDFGRLSGCSIFHIAYALLLDSMDKPDAQCGTVMARTLRDVSECGLITSMDVVSEQGERFAGVVTPSLRYCDYLIVNEIEASGICGIPARDAAGKLIPGNIEGMLEALLGLGVRKLAAIHAPEGGWCAERGGSLHHRPSLKLPAGYIQGTVGAGDAFCAGMLYALNRGDGPARALEIGAAAAACILGRQGGFGMKKICEVEAMANIDENIELW